MARADGMMTRAFDTGGGMSGGGAMAASPEAMYELGKKYVLGRDVAADLVIAHKWFNLSAQQGNAAAKSYRMEISGEMTKAQIAQAQKLAREHLTGGSRSPASTVARPFVTRGTRYA